MSIHEDCTATLFVADYATVDGSNKVNALGVAFEFMGLMPTGQTGQMTLTVLIDVPPQYINQEFPICVELRDEESAQVVMAPNQVGELEPMRIQTVSKVNQPQLGGAYLPGSVYARCALQVGFPNGLLVTPGRSYRWTLEVEGHTRPDWVARFHVLGPPPGPIVGGFNNPMGAAGMPPFDTPPAAAPDA